MSTVRPRTSLRLVGITALKIWSADKMSKTQKDTRCFLLMGAITAVFTATLILCLIMVMSNNNAVFPTQPQRLITVLTDCGGVTGRQVSTGGVRSYEFIDIPYAVPPTNERRWKNPEMISKNKSNCWKGDFPAYGRPRKICPQLTIYSPTKKIIGDEDCLYLSVRTPNVSSRLPVLVWIHGGIFVLGSKDQLGYSPDAEFTTRMDVVSVNINYRLSLFGFFSLKELWDEVPGERNYGNLGFLDQITALKWVQKNIESFGGDPNAVTLIGQSAGGTSVLILAASPLANGLFHKVIAQSPTAPHSNFIARANLSRTLYLPYIGCTGRKDGIYECLYGKTTSQIINGFFTSFANISASWYLPKPDEFFDKMAALDPIVLPVSPMNMRNAPFVPKYNVPILISSMAQECDIQADPIFHEDQWNKMHDYVASYLDKFNRSIASTVFKLYPNVSVSGKIKAPQEIYETLVSDIRWTCQVNDLARGISNSTNHTVHRLYIKHHPSVPFMRRQYAFHTWDSLALFGLKEIPNPTDHDRKLMHMLRTAFKEFIHNGTFMDKWHSYPETSAVLENESENIHFINGSVQEDQCMFLKKKGLGIFSV